MAVMYHNARLFLQTKEIPEAEKRRDKRFRRLMRKYAGSCGITMAWQKRRKGIMKKRFKVIGYYICEINDTPKWQMAFSMPKGWMS